MWEPKEPRGENLPKVPLWLRWMLVFFIASNIIAFIALTTFTTLKINKQIAVYDDPESEEIKQKKAHKMKLFIITSVEVLLDLVDLFNVFYGNYHVHVTYLAMKMLSVGLWAYTNTNFGHTALWIIPVGISIIVSVVLLEWFANLRQFAIISLMVVAAVAWIGIVAMRLVQISKEIDTTQLAMEQTADTSQHGRFINLINEQKANQLEIIIGSLLMLLFGSLTLVAVCLEKLWLVIVVALLNMTGLILWTVKLVRSQTNLDIIFTVPIAYSALTLAIIMCYLSELAFSTAITNKEEKKPKIARAKRDKKSPRKGK